MKGWIKLHRILIKKSIWIKSTPEQKTILITILCLANHEKNQWEWMGNKFEVEPGQFITSLDSLAKESGKGISTQNVRSAIKRFEKLDFLTNKSTKEGRLITICNWETYQQLKDEINKPDNKGLTNGQQRGNKVVTPNKNDNNDKNETSINIPFDEFWNLYDKKMGDKSACEKKWQKLKDSDRSKIISTLPDFKQQFSEKQYQPFPATYLNQKRWNDEIIKGKQTYSIKDL